MGDFTQRSRLLEREPLEEERAKDDGACWFLLKDFNKRTQFSERRLRTVCVYKIHVFAIVVVEDAELVEDGHRGQRLERSSVQRRLRRGFCSFTASLAVICPDFFPLNLAPKQRVTG